ncbi:MAG: O-antigen ligase family protein [Victivallales bacterium]|nr:O-antigen ligase family protein [Victivallales bacterium]
MDTLFVVFVLLVSFSLILNGSIGEIEKKIASYLPFMVVTPYLCGRLMHMSDISALKRIIIFAGIAILPFLVIDRLTSPVRGSGHWPFFDHDHSAILIGALLSISAIAMSTIILDKPNDRKKRKTLEIFVLYIFLWIITAFLVWITARGWLLAGILGIATTCLLARQSVIWKRFGLLISVLAIAALCLSILPKVDPQSYNVYAMPMKLTQQAKGPILGETTKGPILGESSCKPLQQGISSFAIRWVLYKESLEIFRTNPIWGIGAGRFGDRSCAGPGGFPHSTILQTFAEMGFVGGGLFIGMLIIAGITMIIPFLRPKIMTNCAEYVFVFALYLTFLFADQIYGNYIMSTGTWLTMGIISTMNADKRHSGLY